MLKNQIQKLVADRLSLTKQIEKNAADIKNIQLHVCTLIVDKLSPLAKNVSFNVIISKEPQVEIYGIIADNAAHVAEPSEYI